ncbi:hypothetical protein LPJ66_008333 [Kickxella alabastrina]|uniref:Uncharacterized protein n=1 Tax=Kickxella alabastrina TaxID=61397 RepID=A0ACC1I6L9_9FUNG|nr:hypothetical protein LPJ66_008333 [Kickxella alabastrina]
MLTSPSVRASQRRQAEGTVDDARKKQATGARRPAWLAPLEQQQQQQTGQHAAEHIDADDSDGSESTHSSVLLQGDRHAVYASGALPDEAAALVAAARACGAAVASGASEHFAFVATAAECVVWSLARSALGSGVHRLEMPGGGGEAPVVVLIGGGAGDVGVLACSGGGRLRLWARVVFGLGGAARFRAADLGDGLRGDVCERALLVHGDLAVVATRRGRLFQVALGGGELHARQLSRSAEAGGSLLGAVAALLGGGSGGSGGSGGDALVGLAAGARTELRQSREVLLLTRTRLVKWVVSRAHGDRLLFSADVARTLRQAAAARFGADADVELLDVAATHAGDVCVLVALHTARRSMAALALLSAPHVSAEPAVAALWPLATALDTSSLRLALPAGGPALFVVAPRAVVVGVLPPAAGAARLALEAAVCFRGAVLGFGAGADAALALVCEGAGAGVLRVAADVAARQAGADAAPAREGAEADELPGEQWPRPATRAGSSADSLAAQTRALTAQLEQAVFFGSDSSPLAFAIASSAPGEDAALQAAALHVSRSVLDGSSRLVADRLDLGAHLRERLRRAHAVMRVLAANGLAAKVSAAARAQLCAAAEQLAAASALWAHQNAAWAQQLPSAAAQQLPSAAAQLLPSAAAAFLEARGLRARDALRELLRHHTAALGALLAFVHGREPALRRALEASERGAGESRLVAYEASRIVAAALHAALRYRFAHAELYAVPADLAPEHWTAAAPVVDLLEARLEATYALCRDLSARHCAAIHERIERAALPGDDAADGSRLSVFDDAVSASFAGEAGSDAEPDDLASDDDPYASPAALLRDCVNLMGPLANLCFRAFLDRIASLRRAQSPGADAMCRRYDAVRPRFLLSLVPLARAPVAFRLAEEYCDLATLVALVFATDAANAAEHLRNYVGQFGAAFGRTLLAYYERRRAWASLLYTQDSAFDAWLKDYIDEREQEVPHGPMAQIGWVHDVKVGDFGAAAGKLARAALDSDEVSQTRTLLSLSKLAFVIADAASSDQSDSGTGDRLASEARTRLEDVLELCEVQESLQGFVAQVAAVALPLGAEDAIERSALDAAMRTTTPELRHERPALYTAYCDLLTRSLGGRTLDIEDILDLLTFPDNITVDSDLMRDRHCLAVDILSRTNHTIPASARNAALRTIWRRVFISDNWAVLQPVLSAPNVPDKLLRSNLRATELYHILRSCLAVRELPYPDCFISPTEAFALDEDLEHFDDNKNIASADNGPPSPSASRVLLLSGDYIVENNRLQGAVEHGLSRYFDEIMRMVADESSTPKSQFSRTDSSSESVDRSMDEASESAEAEGDGDDVQDVNMDSD